MDNSKGVNPGLVLLVIILLIITLTIGFFFVRQRHQLVEPSRCPKIQGTFGLLPGTTGEVINLCGSDSKSECVVQVESLEQAVLQCNMRKDICTHFTHDSSTGTLRIINPSIPFSQTNTENMYIRQV